MSDSLSSTLFSTPLPTAIPESESASETDADSDDTGLDVGIDQPITSVEVMSAEPELDAASAQEEAQTEYLSTGNVMAGRVTILQPEGCLLYTSPSPRDQRGARMPSSA